MDFFGVLPDPEDHLNWFPVYEKPSTSARGASSRKYRREQWNASTSLHQAKFVANDLVRPQELNMDFLRRTRQINMNVVDVSSNTNVIAILESKPPNGIQFVEKTSIYGASGGKPRPKWVKSEDELKQLVLSLQNAKEFALDLEGHSIDTKQGYIALIQISTWDDGDFLVDPIALYKPIKTMLKPILEDPAIVKIMHGSDNDLIELQKGFSIFLGGLLDTQILYKKVNGGQPIGFNNMCMGFYPQNQDLLQVVETASDFRLREDTGFTEKQMIYATNDSHFLLRVFNDMKRIMSQQGQEGVEVLKSAFEMSRNLCLQRKYKNPSAHPPTPMKTMTEMLNRLRLRGEDFPLGQNGLSLLEKLVEWRTVVGNALDKKDMAVLSDIALVTLARRKPNNLFDLEKTLLIFGPITFPIERQKNVILELIKTGNIQKLRDTECNNCLTKGHGTSVFCPLEKMSMKKVYLARPENAEKKKERAARKRKSMSAEKKAQRRKMKLNNKRIKIAKSSETV